MNSDAAESDSQHISFVVLTHDALFLAAVSSVAEVMNAEVDSLNREGTDARGGSPIEPWLRAVAQTFLESQPRRPSPCWILADEPEAAVSALCTRGCPPVYMVVVDATAEGSALDGERKINAFYRALDAAAIRWRRNAYSVVLYTRRAAVLEGSGYSLRYINRVREPGEPVDANDLLSATLDVIDLGVLNRRAFRAKKPVAFGNHLCDFLSQRGPWDAYYFTGSVISSLIETVEARRYNDGKAFCITGPNEHSLACGALANYVVHGRQYLIIVTSGMGDELKGTLANLRDADAKGIVVLAESFREAWFPFQGTQHAHEDMRAVYEARGITSVYLSDRTTYRADLSAALARYQECRGPLVLFVRAEILGEAGDASARLTVPPPACASASASASTDWQVQADGVLEMLNHQAMHVLWQCGPLSPQARADVLAIAEQSGIALTDSLTRPGTVPHYLEGRRVENVLRGMSLYGFSSDVYRYLHRDGHLRGKGALMLGFLSSKIAQMATPFPEARMQKQATVLQVNQNPAHIAPFAQIACVCETEDFLRYVRKGLNVDASVLAFRRSALQTASEAELEVSVRLRSRPVSSNHFFFSLNAMIEGLIRDTDYRYTGVYDVGRNGISAYRNVARTDVGFSGWYGRALMGDAWLSLIGLCVNTTGNVIAFVGDGARAMQPDIVPHLIENLTHHGAALRNLTVFIMVNGQLGLISSYQERFLNHRARRQMRVPWTPPEPARVRVGELEICYDTLLEFEESKIREMLCATRRINIVSVVCAHNSFADGVTLASLKSWQEVVD
jgi:thiamine pyrophosphate-dependent acetolactate synthase large subunit-like protein